MKVKFLEHYETIGKNVRFLRNKKGWTQDDLAHRCSINSAQVSRIENARRDYMHSTLLEVCDGLETDYCEIIKRDEEAEKFHIDYLNSKNELKKNNSV